MSTFTLRISDTAATVMLVLTSLLVVSVAIRAYATSQPAVFGHSATEIGVNISDVNTLQEYTDIRLLKIEQLLTTVGQATTPFLKHVTSPVYVSKETHQKCWSNCPPFQNCGPQYGSGFRIDGNAHLASSCMATSIDNLNGFLKKNKDDAVEWWKATFKQWTLCIDYPSWVLKPSGNVVDVYNEHDVNSWPVMECTALRCPENKTSSSPSFSSPFSCTDLP